MHAAPHGAARRASADGHGRGPGPAPLPGLSARPRRPVGHGPDASGHGGRGFIGPPRVLQSVPRAAEGQERPPACRAAEGQERPPACRHPSPA
jgi:hypothetical protein